MIWKVCFLGSIHRLLPQQETELHGVMQVLSIHQHHLHRTLAKRERLASPDRLRSHQGHRKGEQFPQITLLHSVTVT